MLTRTFVSLAQTGELFCVETQLLNQNQMALLTAHITFDNTLPFCSLSFIFLQQGDILHSGTYNNVFNLLPVEPQIKSEHGAFSLCHARLL